MMPDDGHPDLAYQVLNVTGDERDEIIVWDQDPVWIYTQDRPFKGKRMYQPSATRCTTIRTTAQQFRSPDGSSKSESQISCAPLLRRGIHSREP